MVQAEYAAAIAVQVQTAGQIAASPFTGAAVRQLYADMIPSPIPAKGEYCCAIRDAPNDTSFRQNLYTLLNASGGNTAYKPRQSLLITRRTGGGTRFSPSFR